MLVFMMFRQPLLTIDTFGPTIGRWAAGEARFRRVLTLLRKEPTFDSLNRMIPLVIFVIRPGPILATVG